MAFSIQHAKDGPFKYDGLRKYFEYRDLGIAAASGGLATAAATRIVYGSEWVGQVTAKAATSFQMLGQTVNVRSTTVFNGTAGDLTTLAGDDTPGRVKRLCAHREPRPLIDGHQPSPMSED